MRKYCSINCMLPLLLLWYCTWLCNSVAPFAQIFQLCCTICPSLVMSQNVNSVTCCMQQLSNFCDCWMNITCDLQGTDTWHSSSFFMMLCVTSQQNSFCTSILYCCLRLMQHVTFSKIFASLTYIVQYLRSKHKAINNKILEWGLVKQSSRDD